jgi:hypothetical protein
MPVGDPQRTWFPEMIQQLRSEWHPDMSFPDLIAMRDFLDAMLHEIRLIREIPSMIVRCHKCGHIGPSAEPRVSVRAMILSLGRFEIAASQCTKALERQGGVMARKTGLICMARQLKPNPVLTAAHILVTGDLRICENGWRAKLPRTRLWRSRVAFHFSR